MEGAHLDPPLVECHHPAEYEHYVRQRVARFQQPLIAPEALVLGDQAQTVHLPSQQSGTADHGMPPDHEAGYS